MSIHVSNVVRIAALNKFDNSKITALDFLGNSALFTNVSSDVGIGLYAIDGSDNIYEVSSPLMGTEWIIDNPEIASVTEAGTVMGLKEGKTILTAKYGGFIAAISVDVEAAYGSLNDESEQDFIVINKEEDSSIKDSVGGCNSGFMLLSLFAIAALRKFKK